MPRPHDSSQNMQRSTSSPLYWFTRTLKYSRLTSAYVYRTYRNISHLATDALSSPCSVIVLQSSIPSQ